MKSTTARNQTMKKDPVQAKKDLKFERDKEREMVRGIFKFYEVPGGQISFVYKKYKEDPVEKYTMVDGEIYTIPLGVAKHLNKNGWYPVHQHAVDEVGKPSVRIGQKVRRFGFQSLEFVDTDDITEVGVNDIVTVENV